MTVNQRKRGHGEATGRLSASRRTQGRRQRLRGRSRATARHRSSRQTRGETPVMPSTSIPCANQRGKSSRGRAATRGREGARHGRRGRTEVAGNGEGYRRRQRTPVCDSGGLAAQTDEKTEGKGCGGHWLYSHGCGALNRSLIRAESGGEDHG